MSYPFVVILEFPGQTIYWYVIWPAS